MHAMAFPSNPLGSLNTHIEAYVRHEWKTKEQAVLDLAWRKGIKIPQVKELIEKGKTKREAILEASKNLQLKVSETEVEKWLKELKKKPRRVARMQETTPPKETPKIPETFEDEQVLGIVAVQRTIIGFARSRRLVYEMWHFGPDRVVVTPTKDLHTLGSAVEFYRKQNWIKEGKLSLERLVRFEEQPFAIPYSEITSVELKKGWLGTTKLKVLCKENIKYEGNPLWLIEREKAKIEDYENVLRPIFEDKLFVKK
jgi:hypothetical protein